MRSQWPGQQFGNYRLLRLLGEGGFAQVYLGEHVHLGTYAAVKLLTSKLVEEEIAHFRQEARLSITLDHPHIVRVLDFGIQESIPFLVMAYAPHGSLRHVHPRGSQLPLPRIVTYLQQMASALHYLHDRKLIHRDVKPENMLVLQEGSIALSDFGIAVVAHSERSLRQQEVGGTAIYMAPEQFHGQARAASDQYALAIVAYEWLCGHPPFHGTMVQLGYQHACVPPPPIAAQRPISPQLEQVLFKALAKHPQDRFESVEAFAQAFAEASQANRTEISYGSATSAGISTPSAQISRSTLSRVSSTLPFAPPSSPPALDPHLRPSPSEGWSSESAIPTASAHLEGFPPVEPTSSPPFTTPPFFQAQPSLSSRQTFSPTPTRHRSPPPRSPRSVRTHPDSKQRKKPIHLGLGLLLVSMAVILLGSVGIRLGLGLAVLHLFSSPATPGETGGSIATANDFLDALVHQQYDHAYADLADSITIAAQPGDFTRQAQRDDHCYGQVTAYTKTGAATESNGNQHLTFSLRRAKLGQPYVLPLTLMQDQTGQWKITDYGGHLGPASPTCA